MTNNPVRWFEIYVQDMNRAKKFYEGVFDLRLEMLTSPSDLNIELWKFPAAINQMGTSGALAKMEGSPSGGNSTIVYFACSDCAVEESRVANFGGRVQKSKTSIGQYGYITLAYDTEGNMFGLHSME